MKRYALFLPVLFLLSLPLRAQYPWQKLAAAPSNGSKQDDIYFVTPETGWSINGSGRIYRTTDGGQTWQKQLDKPGTYFRCVGFIDSLRGFAGNIGTDYYPGVTDETPLYATSDGGASWSAVENIEGPGVKGLCAINVVTDKVIYAGGRVGGPTYLIKSTDGGQSWLSSDMSGYCAMILDIKFFNQDTGFVFAATDANPANSHALVIGTEDGGKTWKTVFTSSHPAELTWKASFPTRNTGYCTILNYDQNSTQRYVAKTTDGGKNWFEMPLINNKAKEFGIGFIDENTGWVGTDISGYETTDGGNSWRAVEMGKAVNKIRLLKSQDGFTGYAIGLNIYKLRQTTAGMEESGANGFRAEIMEAGNPGIRMSLPEKALLKIDLYDSAGKLVRTIANREFEGETVIPFEGAPLGKGVYLCVISGRNFSRTLKLVRD